MLTSPPAAFLAEWPALHQCLDLCAQKVESFIPGLNSRIDVLGPWSAGHYSGGLSFWRDMSIQTYSDAVVSLSCGHYDVVMQTGATVPEDATIDYIVRFVIEGERGVELAAIPPSELPPLSNEQAHRQALREYIAHACAFLEDSFPILLDALQAAVSHPPVE